MAGSQACEDPKVCQDGTGGTTYREAAMITLRFIKQIETFLKITTRDGDNTLQKNSDVFHLGRTWFKTNSLGRKIRTEEFNLPWVSPSRTRKVLTFPALCPLTPNLGMAPRACWSPGFKPSLPNLSLAPVLRPPLLLWLYLHSSDDCSLKWS